MIVLSSNNILLEEFIMHKNFLKQYIKNVKNNLPAVFPNRRTILKDLQNALNAFCHEHPISTYAELCNNFGSPESYVESLISHIPASELFRKSHLKTKTYFSIVISIIAIVFLSIALWFFSILYYEKNKTLTYEYKFIANNEVSTE